MKNFINLHKNSYYGIIGILPKEITGFTGSSAFNTNHHKILKRCEEITRYRIFFVYLQYLKTNQSNNNNNLYEKTIYRHTHYGVDGKSGDVFYKYRSG